MTKMRVLILYSEIMGYLLSGLKAFHQTNPDVEIHVFELDDHKLTPFSFTESFIVYYKKSDYQNFSSFETICKSIHPNLLIVSGRTHAHYLSIAQFYKNKILTVSIQDTQNDPSIRTFIKCLFANFLYKRYFMCLWVTGPYGIKLGNRLGYSNNDIYNYCYSADTKFYSSLSYNLQKKINRKIIFVGRFVKEKNINFLVEAFKKVNKQIPDKWNLILVGHGELSADISDDKHIQIFPFLPPERIKELAREVDVFCLPSIYEPWGVVVHEFACMGKVLLISDRCGSKDDFVINGFNGYSFNPYDSEELERKLLSIFTMDESEIFRMKNNSLLLSNRISSDIWAGQLKALLLRSLTLHSNY